MTDSEIRGARRRRLVEVAEAYYLQGRSMVDIARDFDLSRSTVSRMLVRARERGVVEVIVHSGERVADDLSRRVGESYSVAAQVVDVADDVTGLGRLDEVAAQAARLLSEIFGPDMTLDEAS